MTGNLNDKMNRFTLEQAIMNAWQTADDLDLLIERVLEDENMTMDEIANALTGISQLHNMRAKKVFRIFEQLIESGDIV